MKYSDPIVNSMASPAAGILYGPLVVCADFAASFGFYHDTIGLATETDGSPPWAEFQSSGVRLVLLEKGFYAKVHGADAPPLDVGPGGTVVFAIQVPDVDAAYRRISDAGRKFFSPPTDRPMMGVRNAILRDPDGNVVEISTKLKGPA
ncbi:MAG: VOC family protein [Thermoplasmata archaeon]|nr:VOC family protein [Thermoplasmata archaeon]